MACSRDEPFNHDIVMRTTLHAPLLAYIMRAVWHRDISTIRALCLKSFRSVHPSTKQPSLSHKSPNDRLVRGVRDGIAAD